MAGATLEKEPEQAAKRIVGALFHLVPLGIEIYDVEGRQLEANKKCREIFGGSDGSVILAGSLLEASVLSPESRAALQQGRQVSFEVPVDFDAARASGGCSTTRTGTAYLAVIIEPILLGPDRTVSNYIVLYRDITERKLVEFSLRESEERFRKVFEDGPVGMVIVDRQFHFRRANPAFCALVGYAEEELQRLTFKDITHPSHLAADVENVSKVLGGDIPWYSTEKRYVRKDGAVVWGAAKISVVRDTRGDFLHFLTVVEDITQRKHAEELLSEATERLALATSSGKLGVWDWSVEDNVMVWNDRMLELYGITRRQFTGTVDAWLQGVHPDDRQRAVDECQRALDGTKEWNTEFRALHPSGQAVHIKANGVVVRNREGKPVRMIGINSDITESKRAELELRLSQARTSAILAGIADTFYSLNTDWRFTTVNPAAEKAPFGRPASEMIGRVIWELYPRLVGTPIHQHYLDAAQKKCLEHYEAQSPLDGRWYEVFMQGWSGGVDVYMRDITDRKRAEESLRENEAIFSTFLEHSPVHVFFKDPQARALRMSRSYESMLGMPLEQALGKSMEELFPSDLAKSMTQDDLRILREGKRVQVVEQLGERVYETTKFPIFVDGTAAMLAGFTVDITERRRAEQEREKLQGQLVQAQKMESVGRLAGGVAHDFNNMLGVMLGHLELAEEQVEPSSPVAWNLKEIHQAARRSADLTKQLLAFARKQTIAPKMLDLNQAVEGMLAMLRRLVGENIQLQWNPGQAIGLVLMDPTQIHQVLVNLCVNARDAIKDVGRVEVATSKVQVDDTQGVDHSGVPAGEYVALTITDDGCGMDAETIAKLFEPFFTTKELGRGTGLGLSTVEGIVKQNGGYIFVHSESGRGSTFRIYLPAHPCTSAAPACLGQMPSAPGGRETILLVEDEETLLHMTQRMLEKLGYQVLAANKPEAAVRLAADCTGTIDLLVTDVVMPDMNGRELASAICKIFPRVRCLYISGYTADFIASQGVLEEGISLLQKPFARHELAAAVRRVLDTDTA